MLNLLADMPEEFIYFDKRTQQYHNIVWIRTVLGLPSIYIRMYSGVLMVGAKVKLVSAHHWACLSVLQEMYRWT